MTNFELLLFVLEGKERENLIMAREDTQDSDFDTEYIEKAGPAEALGVAFIWQRSKQGHYYWFNVAKKLNEMTDEEKHDLHLKLKTEHPEYFI